ILPSSSDRPGELNTISFTFAPAGEQPFLIPYVVTGAVRPHSDATEMFWTWFDTRNKLDFDTVDIDVAWPETAGPPLLAVGGLRDGRVNLDSRSGGASWHLGHLAAKQVAETRVVIDTAVTAPLRDDKTFD